MSPVEALVMAEAAGVVVTRHGDRLKIGSYGEAHPVVIDALQAAKPQIILLLTPDASGANGYWRVFNERSRTARRSETSRCSALPAAGGGAR
jgi:hypothetical protein